MSAAPIKKAFATISQLEPISPNASPKTRARFKNTVTEYYSAAAVIHMNAAGLMEASDIEMPEIDWQGPVVAAKPAISHLNRVVEILDGHDEPLPAPEWIDRLTRPPAGTMHDREQQAFIRLLCGYLPCKDNATVTNVLVNGSYSGVYATALEIDANGDSTERLHAREEFMSNTVTTNTIHAYMHSLICTINALRFAAEWNKLSNEPGGRLWKTRYRAEAFNRLNADFVSSEHTKKEFNQRFSAFSSRHEKVILARNELRKLYQKFGAAVLLDPLWTPTASYGKGGTGRSPTFSATLNHFLASAPEIDPDVMSDTEAALKQLLRFLLPEECVDYVDSFLVEYE